MSDVRMDLARLQTAATAARGLATDFDEAESFADDLGALTGRERAKPEDTEVLTVGGRQHVGPTVLDTGGARAVGAHRRPRDRRCGGRAQLTDEHVLLRVALEDGARGHLGPVAGAEVDPLQRQGRHGRRRRARRIGGNGDLAAADDL